VTDEKLTNEWITKENDTPIPAPDRLLFGLVPCS